MGVRQAYGVIGGAIAHFYGSLSQSRIIQYHCRHETGAAFAAVESYFASNFPVLVFTTTGPGFMNVLTGVASGKSEGAKLIVISGATSSSFRGRFAAQETSCYTYTADFGRKNSLFDFSVCVDSVDELSQIVHRINMGFQKPEGFIAHLSLPLTIQKTVIGPPATIRLSTFYPSAPSDAALQASIESVTQKSCVVVVGYGARHASKEIIQFIDKLQVKVFSTPRGKGIVPEKHPLYLGCTGVGGSENVVKYMQENTPEVLLVLGSRLGEGSTYWDDALLPSHLLIHVDIDSTWMGCAYPEHEILGVQADITNFLQSLLPKIKIIKPRVTDIGKVNKPILKPTADGKVRPSYLMQCLQSQVVDPTDAILMSEVGNAFAWCTHLLKFNQSGRYRVSPGYGSMGHFTAGAVGAALATNKKVVAVIGDGSMLMNSEVNTAVQYGAPVVWIVLNDGAYDTCEKGMDFLGIHSIDLPISNADFSQIAQGMGAVGLKIRTEGEVQDILAEAMQLSQPVVIDVLIDETEVSPLFKRFENLSLQSHPDHVSGWEQ